jgi:hypothetical protein
VACSPSDGNSQNCSAKVRLDYHQKTRPARIPNGLLAQANPSPWIEVAIRSLILLAPIGPLVINPRLHRIADAADLEPDSPIVLICPVATRVTDLVTSSAL